jgi:hypothetical protein
MRHFFIQYLSQHREAYRWGTLESLKTMLVITKYFTAVLLSRILNDLYAVGTNAGPHVKQLPSNNTITSVNEFVRLSPRYE